MDSFISAKRNFSPKDEPDKIYEIGPLKIEHVPQSDWYEPDDGMVRLTRSDMQGLFDPVVAKIIKMIGSQVGLAKSTKNRTIDRFILVGGFGDSEYLYDFVRTWCNKHGNIQVTCPQDGLVFCRAMRPINLLNVVNSQAAIVKGAALRGLQNFKPTSTKSRRLYGFASSMPFRKGIDDPKHAYLSEWHQTWYSNSRVTWMIRKGDALTDETKATNSVSLYLEENDNLGGTHLYCCDADEQPEHVEDPRVRQIGYTRTDFSNISKSSMESKDISGRKLYRFTYTENVLFGQKEGILIFEARTKSGSLIGKTEIQYAEDD